MASLPAFELWYRRFTKYLPAKLSARMDLMRTTYRRGWGGPMNGQERRQKIVCDILAIAPFDEIVETGTFRGGTTAWLNEISGLPVYSVETFERFFLFARATAGQRPNVDIRLGDSRELLRDLAAREDDHSTFFYLDAHWGDDVPRHEELRIIHARWKNCVVLIDDFAVPGDPGYGFALYGGKPLDETYLPELKGWTLFYPAIPAEQESGSRRGCAIFAPAALAAKMAEMPTLRGARHWAE